MPRQEECDHEPSPVAKVVNKLIDVSEVIEHHMGIKEAEEKRVIKAFTLLAEGPPPANSKGVKQRVIYLNFLQRVRKVLDLSKVVLCAAGLGPSAVAGMRDRVRVDLPFMMKEREDEFKGGVLTSLADTYSAQFLLQEDSSYAPETLREELIEQPLSTETASCPTSGGQQTAMQTQEQVLATVAFTGDVYELTVEDARTVAMSDQISGKIWLTDTYGANNTCFITIPISNELADRFIIQRPRVM